MKKIICGYSQQAAIDFGLDLKDLQILIQIHDFIKLGYIYSKEIDGERFYWIKSSFLLSEIPLLEIKSSDVLRRRLKRLTELKILDYRLVKDKGLFTFYRFGENYKLLFVHENKDTKREKENKELKKIVDIISKSKKSEEKREEKILNNIEKEKETKEVLEEKIIEDERIENRSLEDNFESNVQIIDDCYEKGASNNYAFGKKNKKFYPKTTYLNTDGDIDFGTVNGISKDGTNNKQSNINKEKDNKKIYIKKICEEVIEFLNSELDTSYKANSKQIVKLIKRLIELGFTVSDFKKVILNKKRCWKGTDYEIYLRPSTLFRESKFEEYLNEKEILKLLSKIFLIVAFAMGIANNLDIFLVTERLGLSKEFYQFFSGIAGVGVIVGGGLYLVISKYMNMKILYSLIGVFAITVFFEGYSINPVFTMSLQFIDNIHGHNM